MNESRIEHLKKQLEYYDDLYYNKDKPEIEDNVYDSLKEEYLALTGEEEYDYVPGVSSTNPYVHMAPVLSLSKVKIKEQDKLRAELERLWPVVIQPKLDGLTLIDYPDGKLVTRGDGSIGDDITSKIGSFGPTNNAIKDLNGIGTNPNAPVRGEVVMTYKAFTEANENRESTGKTCFKNPRNAAAGILKNEDIKYPLHFIAYNILTKDESNNNTVQLDELEKAGYDSILKYTYIPNSIDDAIEYINNYDRDSLDFQIDGLVIKHNGDKTFGFTNHHPKSDFAVKFNAESKWTDLEFIDILVGRTGKIVPRANFKPVDIDGSQVSKATLHNPLMTEALGLNYTNCSFNLLIEKANDIIPAVIKVKRYNDENSEPYDVNTLDECPVCNSKLDKSNIDWYCRNEDCPAKLIGRLVHMCSKQALNIEGLSEKTLEKILDLKSDIKDISLVFNLTKDDIIELEGFKDKSANKLLNSINTAMEKVDLDKAIYSAGMPNVGRTASKLIAKEYKEMSLLIDDLMYNQSVLRNRLDKIEGIGDKIISSLIKRKHYLLELLPYIKSINPVEDNSTASIDNTFVITGSFEISRDDIKKLIESRGGKVSSSVSKKTDYLVAGEKAGSKLLKAVDLGVRVISLNELKNILEER